MLAYKKVGQNPRPKGRGGNKAQEADKDKEKPAESELEESLANLPVPQRILFAKNKLCGGLFRVCVKAIVCLFVCLFLFFSAAFLFYPFLC